MTIKELEQEIGMDRANIRFYEKEGLIHPVRRKNGGTLQFVYEITYTPQ